MKLIAILGGLMVSTILVSAATPWAERFGYTDQAGKFADTEFSVDLFGVAVSEERERLGGDSLGIGAGVNYFFCRYAGVGAETYLDELDFPDHIDFSAIGRFPLEDWSVAPYVFAGFGRQYSDVSQWSTHIGVGAEFRLNSATGLFVDLRRVFPDETRDSTDFRFGVRLVFGP